MINDAVGRASLLPRLSSARNKVYPCTRYQAWVPGRLLNGIHPDQPSISRLRSTV